MVNQSTRMEGILNESTSMDGIDSESIDSQSIDSQSIDSQNTNSNSILYDSVKYNRVLQQIHYAIHILESCQSLKYHQFYNPKTKEGSSMYTCGYTAPGLAFIMRFLEFFDIGSDEELVRNHISVLSEDGYECRTVTDPTQLLIGINNAIGLVWDLHTPFGHGIMHHINDPEWAANSLEEGVNMISFVNKTTHVTFHHSFVYKLEELCIVVDSWNSNTFSRPIQIRVIPTERVVKSLLIIHTNQSTELIRSILHRVFLGPNLHVPSHEYSIQLLSQKVINSGLQRGLIHGCKRETLFGGMPSRKSKGKSKSKSKSKRKTKRTKRNC